MSLTNASLSQFTIPYELYPKKDDKEPTWLEKQVNSLYTLVKYRVEKQPWRYQSFADRVLGLHNKFDELDDQSLSDCVLRLKRQARTTGVTTDYLVEAFALIREVSARELNMRHYKAQVIGGWALVNGMIAEMETGQGKTLTATLAAGAIAMAGIPTHVITVNRYLAERDADTMGPVFRVLGLSVGVVTDEMQSPEKKQAYACDLTYCTNKDVAFDHLRDRMTMSNVPGKLQLQLEALYSDNKTQEELILRGLCYAIVDEADSVLIDEAVTPLIISATTNNKEKVKAYQQALFLAEQCEQTTDYLIEEAAREVKLTEDGKEKLKMLCNNIGGLWKSTTIREELVIQALRSMYLYVRDQHYIVNDGKVQIVDESTGRVMPDRSWERGLHQMIEVREACEVSGDRTTMARISYQRFFRRYLCLSGMTGTAREVKKELRTVYNLNVLRIPPAQKVRRTYLPEYICVSEAQKWQRIVERIKVLNQENHPVLVGTRSVRTSDILSQMLDEQGLKYQLLNARQDKQEADVIACAGEAGCITIATNMAGRGTDIKLSDEVKAQAGLHVIASERHESRRVDRQLFGRCGRQGDPGSVELIVSLEDELIKVNTHRLWAYLLALLSKPKGEVSRVIANQLFYFAQELAEHRNYIARCSVLKMDEHYGNMLAFSGRME